MDNNLDLCLLLKSMYDLKRHINELNVADYNEIGNNFMKLPFLIIFTF